MSPYLPAFSVSLLFGMVMVRISLPMAHRVDLLASPGGHRRHEGKVPLTGGLAMVLAATAATFLLEVPVDYGLSIGVLLLLLVGVMDDRFSLPYVIRFAVQIAAMMLLLLVDHVRLVDFGQAFGEASGDLGAWSGFLTVFAGVGVINAINMVDGMDGLAGSLALVCLIGGALLISVSPTGDPTLVVVISGVLAGFLVFNLRLGSRTSARVFMGDAGSMVLGLFLSWMLIRYSQGADRAFSPVLALWLLALPLYDAVGVLLRRPLRGGSPFNADWRHTHHLMLRLGIGPGKSLAILLIISVSFALFGTVMAAQGVAESIMFSAFLGLFLIYLLLMEVGERLARSIAGTGDVGN